MADVEAVRKGEREAREKHEAAAAELKALQTRLLSQRQTLAEKEQKKKTLEANVRILNAQIKSELRDRDLEGKAAADKLDRYKSTIEALASDPKMREILRLKEETDKKSQLQTQARELEAQMKDLQNQLNAEQEETRRLEAETKKKKEEEKRLAEIHKMKMAELKRKIQDSQQAVADYEEQITDRVAETEKLKVVEKTKRVEIKELNDDIDSTISSVEQIKAVKKQLKDELEKAKNALSEEKQSVRKARLENHKIRTQTQKEKIESDDLMHEVRTLEANQKDAALEVELASLDVEATAKSARSLSRANRELVEAEKNTTAEIDEETAKMNSELETVESKAARQAALLKEKHDRELRRLELRKGETSALAETLADELDAIGRDKDKLSNRFHSAARQATNAEAQLQQADKDKAEAESRRRDIERQLEDMQAVVQAADKARQPRDKANRTAVSMKRREGDLVEERHKTDMLEQARIRVREDLELENTRLQDLASQRQRLVDEKAQLNQRIVSHEETLVLKAGEQADDTRRAILKARNESDRAGSQSTKETKLSSTKTASAQEELARIEEEVQQERALKEAADMAVSQVNSKLGVLSKQFEDTKQATRDVEAEKKLCEAELHASQTAESTKVVYSPCELFVKTCK
eukprot:TRINITY_DN3541_c1_g1_i3.p1 TRINITY_DN3541_c1_g1~~TRINITY_DN3541_c1_g1_i3.p1  ORF type:complete len:642 (+),score=106.50 TRINITY_DN3541_c1_g1_i3:129-2054(+)